MTLELFEEDYQYFPSLKEIRDGLINAQINMIKNESKNWDDQKSFNLIKDLYTY